MKQNKIYRLNTDKYFYIDAWRIYQDKTKNCFFSNYVGSKLISNFLFLFLYNCNTLHNKIIYGGSRKEQVYSSQPSCIFNRDNINFSVFLCLNNGKCYCIQKSHMLELTHEKQII